MERILDHDPLTGVTTYFRPSEDGRTFGIRYHQDVEPILEANKAAQAERGSSRLGEFAQVAEIPIGIQYEWLIKKGIDCLNRDHWPAVKRLLNDPEWRYLKTRHVII